MGETLKGVGVMPKEKIDPRNRRRSAEHPEPLIEVRWGKETAHVQVVTRMEDDTHRLEPTVEGNGWFATLDREQINRLIRALRRARDQAFGADA